MFPSLDANLGTIYFAGLALAALACAVGVLCSRHPLNAAVLLIGAMLSLSGIYALLDAPFLAVVQVLVYAGAVMMLVVFVIMVLNRARDTSLPRFDLWSAAVAAAPVALCALLAWTLSRQGLAASAKAVRGEPEPVAARIFDLSAQGGGWWLLFLAVGVILLVAVVGAVLLAKRRLDEPAVTEGAPAQGAGAGAEGRWADTMGAAHPPTPVASGATGESRQSQGGRPDEGRRGEAPGGKDDRH